MVNVDPTLMVSVETLDRYIVESAALLGHSTAPLFKLVRRAQPLCQKPVV
jgi:hypothetical protein